MTWRDFAKNNGFVYKEFVKYYLTQRVDFEYISKNINCYNIYWKRRITLDASFDEIELKYMHKVMTFPFVKIEKYNWFQKLWYRSKFMLEGDTVIIEKILHIEGIEYLLSLPDAVIEINNNTLKFKSYFMGEEIGEDPIRLFNIINDVLKVLEIEQKYDPV